MQHASKFLTIYTYPNTLFSFKILHPEVIDYLYNRKDVFWQVRRFFSTPVYILLKISINSLFTPSKVIFFR